LELGRRREKREIPKEQFKYTAELADFLLQLLAGTF